MLRKVINLFEGALLVMAVIGALNLLCYILEWMGR